MVNAIISELHISVKLCCCRGHSCVSQLPQLCMAYCRKGKRSALVDHQTKNKEHKQLVQDMELGLKRVMLVGGVAQRLLGKVAIVTGGL